jgi:hypothetical protein
MEYLNSICVQCNSQLQTCESPNITGCDNSKVQIALLNCAHHILFIKITYIFKLFIINIKMFIINI